MKRVLFLFLLSGLTGTNLFAGNQQWPGVSFKYARAFLYNLDESHWRSFAPVQGDQPDSTLLEPGKTMNAAQTGECLRLLNGNTDLINTGLSKCFIPHHAIIFYDETDKPVAWVSICFMCEGIRLFPAKTISEKVMYSKRVEEKARDQMKQLKGIIVNSGLPVYERTEDYASEFITDRYKQSDSAVIEIKGFCHNEFISFTSAHAAAEEMRTCGIKCDSTIEIAAGGRKYRFFTLSAERSVVHYSQGGGRYLPDDATVEDECMRSILRSYWINRTTRIQFIKKIESVGNENLNTNRFLIRDPESYLQVEFLFDHEKLYAFKIYRY